MLHGIVDNTVVAAALCRRVRLEIDRFELSPPTLSRGILISSSCV